MMTRMFPRIGFDKLCLSRSHGGVGLLEPLLQQSALQLRWLEPLFNVTGTSPSYITICLWHHICTTSHPTSDPHLPFVFPQLHGSDAKDTSSVNYLLYRAIDQLPIDWLSANLSATTILQLPLNTIWIPIIGNENLWRPGFKSMVVSDLFIFDSSVGFI